MLQRMIISSLVVFLACSWTAQGQPVDSLTNKLAGFPSRLFSRIQSKTASLDQQLTRQTEKYLQRMARREQRLKKNLSAIDSSAAKNLFANSSDQYASLLQKFKTDTAAGKLRTYSGEYQAHTDSLRTSMSYLQQNPQLLASSGKEAAAIQAQLQSSSGQLQQLQTKIQNTDEIKAFVQQRNAQIKQYLSQYSHLPAGLDKEYQGIGQDMYYYSQQVREYQAMLNDPDAMEKKALALLNQTQTFRTFMTNNSQLATLFGIPGSASGASTAQALPGLQTRDQLQQMVQGQLSGGGTNAMQALQDNLQAGQSQIDALKDKISKYGAGARISNPPISNRMIKKQSRSSIAWNGDLIFRRPSLPIFFRLQRIWVSPLPISSIIQITSA